ncbi:MAG: SH3 domain-containing protein [Clostridia bacterium]|nr:SH3 domain-containing protein [Clostridia bacterium]
MNVRALFLRKRRIVWLFCFLLALFFSSFAAAEVTLSFAPEAPRMGDYVDVAVTSDREDAEKVEWTLMCGEESVYSGERAPHDVASFRPRQEGIYTLQAVLCFPGKEKESAEITIPVSGVAPPQEGADVLYSQKDSWWHDKVYSKRHKRSVEKSGCALFALSHALQRMGISGESVSPDALATAYSRFYINERGTDNEGMTRQAAVDYDFVTQSDLIESEKEIAACLRRGDLFSFSIVIGHIALADRISEDGTKVHIVDSAPGATYERINRFKTKGHVYFLNADGSFTEALSPEELPGIRWFFETGEYGGMEYWMDLSYCAYRGMRLIRPPWLKADLGDGLKTVALDYTGALVSRVTRDGEVFRIPTRDLRVGRNAAVPQIALVTAKKGTRLLDGNGKVISGVKRLPMNGMALLLEVGEDSLYAWWDNAFGFLSPKDVEVLSPGENYRTGVISVNGKTSGTAEIPVHMNPKATSKKITSWKAGTPVAVAGTQDEFLLLEGKGIRGWVHSKYLAQDPEESSGGASGSSPQEAEEKGGSR